MEGQIAVVEFKKPPRSARTQMETMCLDQATVKHWLRWAGQRPIRVNDKVRSAAEEMKTTEVINGVLTLGILDSGKQQSHPYLLDGQHRIEAFKMSGLVECLVDVRVCHFDNMAEMGEEFVRLNSHLVTMRPDDVLRGLEGSMETLRYLTKSCDFIGYDSVRRNSDSPILGMSALLRCWAGSAQETPATGGKSALAMAHELTQESAEKLVGFLLVAVSAWGRDPQYWRLWAALNLTLSMWLWRRLVLDTERGVRRYEVLKPDMFRKCLMSASADNNYLDWLLGRGLSERDRSPCYGRIKNIFVRRLKQEFNGKILKLPSPPWAVSKQKEAN